ncbi:MAG: serine/threonine-protein phosphatase [Flavobacterium sp.]|nr:MAG: serine/threonine-protein phosphatase [Flavobacterium sp.]
MLDKIFYLNEQGSRASNEDSIFPQRGEATLEDRLFIVCDGVGGQNSGEIASKITSNAIAEYLKTISYDKVTVKEIRMAITHSREVMQDFVIRNPKSKSMCTTLALIYLAHDEAIIVWCGDSRIYHVRNGNVIWKSKDHSVVQQLVDEGEITQEEALIHPERNIIIHCIRPVKSYIKIDNHLIDNIQPNDSLLIVTDGVLENINENKIKEILGPLQTETDKEKLFQQYCEGKTSDNYSMYLLSFADNKRNHLNLKYEPN